MMSKPACSICCGHFPVPTPAHSCSTVIALQLADFTAGRYVPVLPSRGRPLDQSSIMIQHWMRPIVGHEQQEQGGRGAQGAVLRHCMPVTASHASTISRERYHECQTPRIAFEVQLCQQRLSVGPSPA